MRISRIYVQQDLNDNALVEIPPEQVSYLSRVLRLKVGDALTLFNGQGGEYPAELISIDKRHANVKLSSHNPREVESTLDITLVQGISRGDRMDTTLQKATELGVTRIIPVFTERSTVSLKGGRLEKRLTHWQGIIQSACEQSGRNKLPAIESAVTLEKYLQTNQPALGLLLAPEAKQNFSSLSPSLLALHLLIGPEGGLSQKECDLCYQRGFTGVSIGPRVLRTETAALAAISSIQTLWGDFNTTS